MNILVTGAAGFMGKNLIENLKNLRDGKNRTRPNISIGKIYEYDRDSTPEDLKRFCADCDFVFHLAGVNRPKNPEEFYQGNFGFSGTLLDTLKKHNNKCPVMVSSSVQASLSGRFGTSDYGKSKLEGENLFFAYQQESGAKALVYRFPNVVGKWVVPNYNSAVATFCHNIANDLPITVNSRETELELLFIEDLIEEMFDALEGKENRCEFGGVEAIPKADGRYCFVPTTHKKTLGEIVDLLYQFREHPQTLIIPAIPNKSFEKKLLSMYVSYLPRDKAVFPIKTNKDERGSFAELIKTLDCGQVSVNVTKPGYTKGQHWHNSKWEFFIVVSGHGMIQERKIGTNEVLEFEVSGDKIEAVHMLPGYTHNIINLSNTENLVTVMWANEQFDSNKPDTFFEKV